jgi:hypothetical protein
MAEAPTPQGLLNTQSFGTIAPYEPNMVERAQGLLAQGLMKFGYDPRDAYVQANKIINTQGDVGAADFTPLAGDLIGAQDSYDMGVDAKRAFDREEYLKALGYGAGSAATGLLSGLGVLGTVVPPVDKGIDAVRAGVKKATGLLDDVDDLGFYSPTERLATTLQPKGTGQQYLGILSKGDGKGSRIQEEMQDMGLDTWLQNKGKVSRDEVLDYIGDNRLRYGEEVLTSGNPYPYTTASEWQDAVGRAERRGDFDEGERLTAAWESSEGLGAVGDSKYQKYAQKGGIGYQENLLTVPERNKITYTQDNVLPLEADHPAASDPERFWYFKAQDRGIDQQVFQIPKSRFNSTGEVSRQEAKDYIIRSKQPEMDTSSNYKSPHYDQSNIGLTTRTQSFNTPQGDSVHLMDELQSDWHSDGRTQGFETPERVAAREVLKSKVDAAAVKVRDARQELQRQNELHPLDWENILDVKDIMGTASEGQRKAYDVLGIAENELSDLKLEAAKVNLKGVPPAPAKQSWMNQGIKKEINQTIADGKEYFAWTGGDIQVDRYSLRKQLGRLDYNPSTKLLTGYKPSGDIIINEYVKPEKLPSFIGKDAADKLLETPLEGTGNRPFHKLEGEQLEVGGEGMKSFYDKDVKKRTEKIIKRLDPNAKVEVIELDNGNKVWGVKITDQMRDKVKGEGMPLYSIAPIAGAGLLGAGMMRQEEQQPQQGILN